MESRTILFPITYECNLSCPFCCVKNQIGTKIDIKNSVEAIKKRRQDIDWVYITGGEPFLVSELNDVCLDLRKSGFKVGVTTNGSIFRDDVAKCVDRFGISLDGDEEYHDSYRGQGVFAKAVKLLKSVNGQCETVVMSTAFRGNEDALKKLKPIVEELNPTYWQIQRDMNDPTLVISEQL